MSRRKTYTFKWPSSKKPNGLAMNCHMKIGLVCQYAAAADFDPSQQLNGVNRVMIVS